MNIDAAVPVLIQKRCVISLADTVKDNLQSHNDSLKAALLTQRDDSGNTTLSRASAFGLLDTVKFILSCVKCRPCEMVCLKNNDGETALHKAAFYGHRETVDLLLSVFSDNEARVRILQDTSEHQNTVLHCAAFNGQADTVTYILSVIHSRHPWLKKRRSGFDKLPVTAAQYSAFHLAIRNRHESTVKQFMSTKPASVIIELLKMENIYGDTPLHHAAANGFTDIIRELLHNGFMRECLITRQNQNGDLPIHKALDNLQTLTANVIISACSTSVFHHVATENKQGLTPIHLAAMAGQGEFLDAVLNEGVSIDKWCRLMSMEDNTGNTPLHLAAYKGQNAIVSKILSTLEPKGRLQLMNKYNQHGFSPLHFGLRSRHLGLIPIFLSYMTPATIVAFHIILKQTSSVYVSERLLLYLQDNHLAHGLKLEIMQPIEKFIRDDSSKNLSVLFDHLIPYLGVKDSITSWQSNLGENLLHLAANQRHYEAAYHILHATPEDQILKALSTENRSGKTPQEAARSTEIKILFKWSQNISGYYHLFKPPAAVIFYTTEGRPGAEEEKDWLAEVLPEFYITPTIVANPTESRIHQTIRSIQSPGISALIVAFMSHGDKGAVWAADRLVMIRDILLTMNAPDLLGKPKVMILQACQAALPSDVSDPTATSNQEQVPSTSSQTVSNQQLPVEELISHTPHDYEKDDEESSLMEITEGEGINNDFDARNPKTSSAQPHFDIPGDDFSILAATINHGYANRCLMIPVLSQCLRHSRGEEDLHEIFLRVKADIQSEEPSQVPEYRTTMSRKFCLHKLFQPKAATSKHRLGNCLK